MTRIDMLLAFLAMLCFAAYMAVMLWKVPSPALIVVSLIGLLMAGYDFARTYRRRGRPNR